MIDRATLAPFAQAELAARERHWPREVMAGTMSQSHADADIAAWRAIVELLETGQTTGTAAAPDPDVSPWAPLLTALRTAQDRRTAAAKEANDRLAAVTGMLMLAERSATPFRDQQRTAA